jgi:tetratricopeptide (TPR) repeat protein
MNKDERINYITKRLKLENITQASADKASAKRIVQSSKNSNIIYAQKVFVSNMPDSRLDKAITINNKLTDSFRRLPNRNLSFVGRVNYLSCAPTHKYSIYNRLFTDNRKINIEVVTGAKGIGKSQLVKQYAYNYEDLYKFIYWLDSGDNIDNSYLEMADNLKKLSPNDFTGDCTQYIDIAKKEIKKFLEKNADWLLIFDNAKDFHQVEDYIPINSKNGHVLITSSNSLPASWLLKQPIQLEPWTKEEAVSYIKMALCKDGEKCSDCKKCQGYNDLLEKVGEFPLALVQICAYLGSSSYNIEKYLKEFSKRYEELWDEEQNLKDKEDPPVFDKYLFTVKVAISLSLDKLKKSENGNLGLDLLIICSLLYAKNIPKSLLKELLIKVRHNNNCFNNAYRELRTVSLIENDVTQSDCYSVHEIIQQVVLNLCKQKSSSYLPKCIEACKDRFKYDRESTENLASSHELISHIFKLFEHSNKAELQSEDFLDLIYKASAYYAYHLAEYDKAILLLDGAKKILKQEFKHHEKYRIFISRLAYCYAMKGEEQKAAGYAKNVLDNESINQKDNKNLDILFCRGILAYIEKHKGHYEVALNLFQELLMIAKDNSNPKTDPHVSFILHQLGVIQYEWKKDYFTARTELKEAREYQRKYSPYLNPHLDVAATYLQQGRVYYQSEDYPYALRKLDKALDIHKKVHGKEKNFKTTIILREIANVKTFRRDYSSAKDHFKESISQDYFKGKRCLELARNHYYYAEMLYETNDFEGAYKNYQVALNLFKELQKVAEDSKRIEKCEQLIPILKSKLSAKNGIDGKSIESINKRPIITQTQKSLNSDTYQKPYQKPVNLTGLFNGKTPQRVIDMARQALGDAELQYGKAMHKGDCFFNSIAQGIRFVKQNPYTTKDIRQVCKKYIVELDKQTLRDRTNNWIYQDFYKLAINLEGDPAKLESTYEQAKVQEKVNMTASNMYYEYLINIEYTEDDIENGLSPNITEALWGDSIRDATILAKQLKISIHVIELHDYTHEKAVSDENKYIINHVLINEGDIKEINDKQEIGYLYQDKALIHIANYKKHFVPVLPKNEKSLQSTISTGEKNKINDYNKNGFFTRSLENNKELNKLSANLEDKLTININEKNIN